MAVPLDFLAVGRTFQFNFFFVCCFILKKKKKENSNRNPFKIRLFVSSCICEYVKPFSAGRIQWLLFARPVYELGMITYLAAGAFLFWMLLFEFFGSSCFHFVVVDWMFRVIEDRGRDLSRYQIFYQLYMPGHCHVVKFGQLLGCFIPTSSHGLSRCYCHWYSPHNELLLSFAFNNPGREYEKGHHLMWISLNLYFKTFREDALMIWASSLDCSPLN